MPFGRRIARFNRTVLNRAMTPLSGRIGPSAIVRHAGRRSGKVYETPVAVIIPLSFGSGADWAKNVLVQGGCEVDYRGQTLSLTHAHLVPFDPANLPLPTVIISVHRLMRIEEYLVTTLQCA